jgi:hypothetical protein
MPARGGCQIALLMLLGMLLPSPACAGEMLNDPDGFDGLHWGSPLAKSPNLKLLKQVDRLSEFIANDGTPSLGEAKIDSMRFVAIDEQFARVIIQYKGQTTHRQILAYLQNLYGPLDRTPGSMMRGPNQQFDWRGENTEVNVLYEAARDRGYVFIESRLLGSKFNEGLSETAY